MPAKTSIILVVCVLSFFSDGCSDGRRPEATVERTDSAGLQIVLNDSRERELRWSFVELFRLGGQDEGPESFFRVNDRLVGVDERGQIVILDRDNYRVVEFDSHGRYVRSFGGRGGGPGEFEFPVQVVVDPSGPVAVYDVRKRALVLFDSSGQPVGQRTLAHLGLVDGVSLRGDSVIFGFRGPRGEDGSRIVELRVAFGSDTSTLASLVQPPATTQVYEHCGVSIAAPPIFSKRLVWRHVGATIAASAAPEYVIDVIGGGQHLSIRRRVKVLDATPDLARRELGDGMELGVGPSRICEVSTGEVIRQRGVASTVPAVRELTVTQDGSVWVRRWRFEDQAAKVDVFHSDGTYAGTLTGDNPFPVAFLPNGDVLAVETDSLDVQQLVAFRIDAR